MKERTMSLSIISAATLVLALTSGNAVATGNCRALDQKSCMASSECRWIKGYQRSDGRKVSPYCRKLPGSSKRLVKENPASVDKRG